MDKIGVKIGLNRLSRAAVKHLWDLALGVQILWDLWDLCEPKGARVRRASVRFNTRRAIQWDPCEPKKTVESV